MLRGKGPARGTRMQADNEVNEGEKWYKEQTEDEGSVAMRESGERCAGEMP